MSTVQDNQMQAMMAMLKAQADEIAQLKLMLKAQPQVQVPKPEENKTVNKDKAAEIAAKIKSDKFNQPKKAVPAKVKEVIKKQAAEGKINITKGEVKLTGVAKTKGDKERKRTEDATADDYRKSHAEADLKTNKKVHEHRAKNNEESEEKWRAFASGENDEEIKDCLQYIKSIGAINSNSVCEFLKGAVEGSIVHSQGSFWYFDEKKALWNQGNKEVIAELCRRELVYLLDENVEKNYQKVKAQYLILNYAQSITGTARYNELEAEKEAAKKHASKFCLPSFIKRELMGFLEFELDDEKFMDKLNGDKDKIAIPGKKVLDLKTKEVVAREASHFFSLETGVTYNPNAKCPELDEYLNDIMLNNSALMNFMQMSTGYLLTGKTNAEIFLIFHGMGSNGKSTFIKVLSEVMGGFFGTLDHEMIIEGKRSISRNAGAADPALMALVHKRCAALSELKDGGGSLSEYRIRSLTSGDRQTARAPYGKKMIEFNNMAKLILPCNVMPEAKLMDATMRRLRAVPWDLHCLDKESFNGDYQLANNERWKNVKLDVVFKTQVALEAFFAWMVEGAFLFYQKNESLPVPEEVKAKNREYKESQEFESPLDVFIHNHCETKKLTEADLKAEVEFKIQSSKLLELFNSKMGQGWGPKKMAQMIAPYLARKDIFKKKSSCEYYYGIKVKTHEQQTAGKWKNN